MALNIHIHGIYAIYSTGLIKVHGRSFGKVWDAVLSITSLRATFICNGEIWLASDLYRRKETHDVLRIIFATACKRLTPITIIPKAMHRYAGIFVFRLVLLSLM